MSSATFPESASFVKQYIPSPPLFIPEEQSTDEYLGKLSSFLSGQYVGLKTLQNSVASGWLIETLRVLDLDADTITADTIFTQDLYIGSDGNGSIGLLGTSTLIEVVDEAGTTRVQIGDFGASNDDWGVKVNNAAGTTIFQATSTTYINGAIITDATLTNAKFPDNEVDGDKMLTGSIDNGKLNSISADKITLSGTLAVNSSDTAINCTQGGNIVIESGGDIYMDASTAGENNLIQFRTSGNNARGYLGYDATANELIMLAGIGTANSDMRIDAQGDKITIQGGEILIQDDGGSPQQINLYGDIKLGEGSSDDTTMGGEMADHIYPNAGNTYDLGFGPVASGGWRDIFTNGSVTTSDLRFGGGAGVVLTEPDKVWSAEDVADGLVMMKGIDDWTPIRWDKADGTTQTTGFNPPDKFPVVYQGWAIHDIIEEIEYEEKPGVAVISQLKDELNEWEVGLSENGIKITEEMITDKKAEIKHRLEMLELNEFSAKDYVWNKKVQRKTERKARVLDRGARRNARTKKDNG